MLLAYVAFQEGTQDFAKLCIIPNEQHRNAIPVNVDLLFQTDSSVFWIGPKEAVTVSFEGDDEAKVIRPVRPAVMFLTPDTPNSPGTRAMLVKVEYPEQGLHKVYFKRELESDWMEWNPNIQVR
ncbi:MAG: hypothetical protein KDD66_17105 [Bdellovibrionales bacterium]|nr:hypothetical protein [Bdellovibrionales bacterium]